jgi:hypothetical protein
MWVRCLPWRAHLVYLISFAQLRLQTNATAATLLACIEVLWGVVCLHCSWSPGPDDSSKGGIYLSQGALLAAVIVPIIIASALLGIALACILCRRFNKHPDSASKAIDGFGKGPMLPPFLAAACFGHKHSKGLDAGAGSSRHARSGKDSAAGAPVVVAVRDGTVSFVKREASGTSCGAERAPIEQQKSSNSMSNSMSRSRAQSGFNDDIAQVRPEEDWAAVCSMLRVLCAGWLLGRRSRMGCRLQVVVAGKDVSRKGHMYLMVVTPKVTQPECRWAVLLCAGLQGPGDEEERGA